MTAFDLYEAAFDPAADPKRTIKYFEGDAVAYVKAYATGAYDLVISDEVANKIVKCAEIYENYIGKQWSNAYYEFVENVLKDIEL